MAATALAVAQSVVVVAEADHGLGQHLDDLSREQVTYVLKAEYAAGALFLASMTLAKLSAITTLWVLAPLYHRRTVLITCSFIILWAFTSIVPALLQCDVPIPWDYIAGQCFQRTAFWIYVAIGDILTDVAIVAIMFTISFQLQLPLRKKMLVGGVFGSRILVTPAIIAHMAVFHGLIDEADATFNMFLPTILAQVVQCLSIVTACVPYLKPFLDSFQSGAMLAVDASSQNTGAKSRSGSGKYAAAAAASAQNSSKQGGRGGDIELASIPRAAQASKAATTATVTANQADVSAEGWDRRSHTSQTVLVQQSWQVDIEAKSPVRASRTHR
ncbi:choline transport protein [Metarhizium guizhouense ARSEF 977]|uniref:Choline transport protein n=1 Tax=Metarhizium guizhouense (strain ARSEF 977) TaxID=1276136 RepID=A0A0B4HSF4_METGA|nr:choline transport protein [Metarhizium guizhouense ARSEF 977]